MKKISNFWLAVAVFLLTLALLTPGPVRAKEEGMASRGVQKEKIAKDLGLAPDKAQAFLAVGEKYDRSRKEIIQGIKNNEDELEKAMAAPQPDEAKITGLVAAITGDHGKLWQTFQVQRQEEMALLTPMQKGKFIMALKKWHQEMCVKYEKQEKKN